ncbi:MAG TPA: copper resistance protein B [Epsilonproteobacteria bacterium]|nr:copper resistance protein B [Campylobacterota bacterium]
MQKLLNTTIISAILALPLSAGMEDNPLLSKVTFDQFEYQASDAKALSWDTSVWVGYDLNKLYLYTEGEKPRDGSTESENQLVLSHAIAPFWDLQYGIGYDKTEDADQTWGVLAISGLAPYYFETRAALLVGEDGNIGLRVGLEYEALFTQRLILTPSLESDFYTKETPEMGLGKGLSNITAGLRLRYEIRREFAPYIGVEWSKNFGNTDDFNPLDETYAVAGVRWWF